MIGGPALRDGAGIAEERIFKVCQLGGSAWRGHAELACHSQRRVAFYCKRSFHW